jgi:hypothetical protein
MAVVLTTRSVGLVVAAALAAGWLGSSISQRLSPAPSAPAQGGTRALGTTATVPRAEKLRERMADPPLPSRGRNPFVYGARRPAPSPSYRRDRADEAVAPMATPTILEPPAPVFRLSGIAATAEGGVTVLTAIVIDNGSMVLAKAGDQLSRGYRVVRVEEASITIADAGGVTQTIKLP